MVSAPDSRLFPIQSERGAAPHPLQIPWSIAEKAYSVYSASYGRSQSLEGLALRGGFCPGEMDELCPGWREEASEIAALRSQVAELSEARTVARAEVERLWSLLKAAGGGDVVPPEELDAHVPVDGKRRYFLGPYEDGEPVALMSLANALHVLRESFISGGVDYDYTFRIVEMTDAEVAALPEL